LRQTLRAGEQNKRPAVECELDLRQRIAGGIDRSGLNGFAYDQLAGWLQLDKDVIRQP
jgi:hypothetical protein